MPVIPVFGSLRQEDCYEFKSIRSYTARYYLKKKKKIKRRVGEIAQLVTALVI